MHLLLVVLLRVFHLFQPDPPIVVARDTTYITEPPRSDGLPDYEKHFREKGRKGVTFENNAAVLFWQALWPNGLDREDFKPMWKELGFEIGPSEHDALQPLDSERTRKRMIEWLHIKAEDFDSYDTVELAIDRAWTSQQCQPLAEWVDANTRPLDLLVEATRRPRFYSPSPSYLDSYRVTLVATLLPGTQNMREAVRSLGVRAMRHVGENRLKEAWVDLLAMHRLADLAAQGPTLIDQLVAIATSGIACNGTCALLSNDHLTPELARQIITDLDRLPFATHMTDCINEFERMSALSVVVDMKLHGVFNGLGVLVDENGRTRPKVLDSIPFDANVVMRCINRWYDRLVTIMRIPSSKARNDAYKKFEANLEADGRRIKCPVRVAAAIVSINARSESIGAIVANLMIPASDAARSAEDRGITILQLTRVAAALALYRAEHRTFPAKLAQLVPIQLKEFPRDVYTSNPLIYKRTEDGYLLYSAGDNGEDDGGDNHQMSLLAGRSTDDLRDSKTQDQPQVSDDADDFSVRMPHPRFVLKLPSASSAVH